MTTPPDLTPSSDLAVGAFTAEGPWVVELDAMPWRDGLDPVRARTQGRVPELIRRRRVPPWRVLRVGGRLLRIAVPWSIRHRKTKDTPEARADLAARVRPLFESLGTTYIKLGQVLASAEGMLPIELVTEFKNCRDRVPAESAQHVRSVIEADLGGPVEELFAEFDWEPLAAASIAQVHAARLATGEEVVVKVQRPRVGEVVAADLAVLAWLAPIIERRVPNVRLANLPAYIELFAETIVEELDFRLEADNMLDVAAVLATADGMPVVVPRPHPTLVGERVLVMQRMRGFTIDEDADIVAAGIDPTPVFRALLLMLVEGALVHGVFHGDLHGGNMLVLPDGKACIFDFGITGRLDPARRQALVGFLLSAVAQDPDAQLRHFQAMGGFAPDADLAAIAAELRLDELTVEHQAAMSPEELATAMQDMMKQLVAHGARMPKPLFLYLKNNIYLNGAVTALAPDIDMLAEVGSVVEHFTRVHMAQFQDELGLDLDADAFSAEAVTELLRTSTGAEAEGMTAAELNALQNERMREMRAARKK